MSRHTKFDYQIVYDWKDQSILFLVTADIIVQEKNKKEKKNARYLNDLLSRNMGIKKIFSIKNKLEKLYEQKMMTLKRKEIFYRIGIE